MITNKENKIFFKKKIYIYIYISTKKIASKIDVSRSSTLSRDFISFKIHRGIRKKKKRNEKIKKK